MTTDTDMIFEIMMRKGNLRIGHKKLLKISQLRNIISKPYYRANQS